MGVASLAAAVAQAPAAAAEPENRVVLNLEPAKESPRNSEGAFVTLMSGRILLVYTQFYGGAGDAAPARLAAVHSDDGGRTWNSPPRTVVENEGRANVMSVSLLRLKSGAIALFYLVKNDMGDCRPVVRFSRDEGESWSPPRGAVDAPGYFVLNNDRVVQLSTGRLVMPVAYHRQKSADARATSAHDSRAIAIWYLSDDEGTTWREADTWWAIPVVSRSGLQEPGVVERADGSLISWMRTDQGAQYGCSSSDAGRTWSAPVPTALRSPLSPASIKRLPGSADLLAIYNDHSGRFPFPAGKRTPLVAGISRDGGQTWPQPKLLEEDPDGWYCYTAVHFVDDALLLGYCAGDAKVGRLNRLRVRRIGLDWLRS